MSSRVCQVCNQTQGWHEQHKPMHAFIPEGEAPQLREVEPPQQPTFNGRGDLVLRLALLKAGVLNDVALGEAETWLRSAAEAGLAVVVEDGEYKLLSIEDWIRHAAGVK